MKSFWYLKSSKIVVVRICQHRGESIPYLNELRPSTPPIINEGCSIGHDRIAYIPCSSRWFVREDEPEAIHIWVHGLEEPAPGWTIFLCVGAVRVTRVGGYRMRM